MAVRLVRPSVGLFLGVVCGCSEAPGHLQLSESSALVVPDSVGVAGVSIGPSGELLLWTPTQNRVVWVRGSIRHNLTDPQLVRPIGAVVLDRSMLSAGSVAGTVEALDAANGAVFRFNPEGRVLSIRKIPGWAGAVQALRARTGWFALMPDSSEGRGYTVQFQADTSRHARRLMVIKGNGTAKAKSVRLSVWGDSLIITQVRSPYASTIVAPDGSAPFALINPSTLPVLKQTRYTWLSMPVIPVEPGFLQVFADAGSDRRLFVSYGRDRRPVRTSFVDAPVGIIASRTAPNYLVGMRRIGRTEVVQYEWTWSQ